MGVEYGSKGLDPEKNRKLHSLGNSQLITPSKETLLLPIWLRIWVNAVVLLPGKSHGWRSLVGWSPWGRSESDRTERLHFHFSPSCIGEGNGNPLQCSCLENPRDRGAWWAAVYGVAQSRTRLKWLSSSVGNGHVPTIHILTSWLSAPFSGSYCALQWLAQMPTAMTASS